MDIDEDLQEMIGKLRDLREKYHVVSITIEVHRFLDIFTVDNGKKIICKERKRKGIHQKFLEK